MDSRLRLTGAVADRTTAETRLLPTGSRPPRWLRAAKPRYARRAEVQSPGRLPMWWTRIPLSALPAVCPRCGNPLATGGKQGPICTACGAGRLVLDDFFEPAPGSRAAATSPPPAQRTRAIGDLPASRAQVPRPQPVNRPPTASGFAPSLPADLVAPRDSALPDDLVASRDVLPLLDDDLLPLPDEPAAAGAGPRRTVRNIHAVRSPRLGHGAGPGSVPGRPAQRRGVAAGPAGSRRRHGRAPWLQRRARRTAAACGIADARPGPSRRGRGRARWRAGHRTRCSRA